MRFIYRAKVLGSWDGRTHRTARGGSARRYFGSSRNPENPKEIGKNKKRDVRGKSNRWNVTEEKWKKNNKRKNKEGSSGTNLGWSEGCRDAEMGTTRRTSKAEKDVGEERNSQVEGGTEETSRQSETPEGGVQCNNDRRFSLADL